MIQLLIRHLDREKVLGYFIIIVYFAGFVGMLTPLRDLFILLTPLTLIFCFVLVIAFHENKDKHFYFYTSLIVLSGFTIELIGVNTGWPFGDYSYGYAFGPQVFGTPLIIGLNWFVLTYCVALIAQRISESKWINALVTGLLVTGIDIILEPVAIQSDYWTWSATSVPIENYVTWFLCVAIFARMIYHFEKNFKNKIVPWVLGGQVLFFISLRIAYLF